VNRLGVRLSTGLSLLFLMSGIALFARIGSEGDYLGVILPPMLLVMGLGIGIGYPALAIAAVSGIDNTEQGLENRSRNNAGESSDRRISPDLATPRHMMLERDAHSN
jgi:hypothetical protein